jgi:hypothetical protein
MPSQMLATYSQERALPEQPLPQELPSKPRINIINMTFGSAGMQHNLRATSLDALLCQINCQADEVVRLQCLLCTFI